MKIKAIKVRCKDLKPGDLFSTMGSTYWDNFDPQSIGQKVYIRTEAPGPKEEMNDVIFKIEIKVGENN